jgi:hypothetical protein
LTAAYTKPDLVTVALTFGRRQCCRIVCDRRGKAQGQEVGRMSPRIAAWTAWSLGILSVVLLAPTLLLFALNLFHPDVDVFGLWIQETVVAVTFPALGLLIVSRRPEHPIGWLFCGAGLVAGLDHFCGEYAIYALLVQPNTLPAGQAAAWVSSWLWVPSNALLVYVALLFPDGRLPSQRWRPVGWLVGIAVVVGVAVAAVLPVPICNVCSIENPLGIEGLESVSELVDALIEAFWYGLGLVAVASLFLRFRRAGGVERQQIKWLAYTASVVVLGAILAYGVYNATGVRWTWQVGLILLAVGFVGTPIAVSVAISRYRLYQIDTLINRTLVYGSLTVLLAAVYVGSVVGLQGALRALTGQKSQLALVASTLFIAALFSPLRQRIQSFIDRRFYRRNYDARKTLQTFSATLRDETDLDAVSDDLVEVVRETMQPAHVSLWLRPDTASKKDEAPG